MTNNTMKENVEGFTVTLPCKPGTLIYHVVDDCEFPSDCYTKRMCRSCEYRNVHVEKETFSLDMLDKDFKLFPEYFLSEEEALSAAEELKRNDP